MHLNEHKKPKMFKCDLCEKTFHLKWRLRKHINGHMKQTKFCHFFNNQVECPFEENVCMFTHSVSPQCKFKDSCLNSLCQFRHDRCTSVTQSIVVDDAFKHVTRSTPIKEVLATSECCICKQGITYGRSKFKCEECEKNVCLDCAKKTYIKEDPDFFMCLNCQ